MRVTSVKAADMEPYLLPASTGFTCFRFGSYSLSLRPVVITRRRHGVERKTDKVSPEFQSVVLIIGEALALASGNVVSDLGKFR